MKAETLIPLAIIAALVLLFVGPCVPVSCVISPSIFRWERREKPIFPLRPKKQHAAPGGLPTEGEAESLHSGAAPANPAPVAAEGIHCNAGCDVAGELNTRSGEGCL